MSTRPVRQQEVDAFCGRLKAADLEAVRAFLAEFDTPHHLLMPPDEAVISPAERFVVNDSPAARAALRWLVANGLDISFRATTTGGTLAAAITECQRGMVEFLLGLGCDVNAGDRYGVTPLLHAVAEGVHQATLDSAKYVAEYREIVRLLLSHGADPNWPDQAGQYPLHAAVQWPRCGLPHSPGFYFIDLLLEHGARVDVADASGKTPCGIAQTNGDTECVRALGCSGVGENQS